MADIKPLAAQQLYRHADASLIDFETTREAEILTDSFGQARAEEALRFGIDIKRPGYNLFVLGDAGSGRHTLVRLLLDKKAAAEPPPGEWCYVHNFADPNKPRALPLPPGRGAGLCHDMQKFVGDLANAVTAAFESDDYRARIEAIQEEFKKREEDALKELGQASSEQGVALLRTPHGFVFAPMKGEEAMDPQTFAQLPDEEKERIGKLLEEFGERLHKLMHQFPRWRREMQRRIRDASGEVMKLAAGHLIEDLKERYTDLANVLSFLDDVMRDAVEAGEALHEREGPKGDGELASILIGGRISLDRYQANLLVDHRATERAPIVFEDNPTYQNLVGRIDHVAQLGTLVTNFTLIRAGALHRANGGYLVLDALKLLTQPFAWEALKRALKSSQIKIESVAQLYGLGGSLPIEPEPVPLSVKLVLVGERMVYYLLKAADPEFDELFKVAADFENEMVRSDESTRLYAQLIATVVRNNALRPFERGAVARIIEQGARIAGDAERLSARTRWLSDLMCEAEHRASATGSDTVSREHVEQALRAQVRRSDRVRNLIQDAVLRETLLISTSGTHIGQINGLAVIDLGEATFGHPVRITATARLGEGDVIDIEREAELGGAIHSKGVMILSSFLATRYAQLLPLSLSASLVFEQSYGPVEGDSASLAELCALISALAGVGIKQSLAVTGSVNQYGMVQAIGAVNEKIEGFFDICRARGLSGEEGVLVPQSNVKHLMLRQDVVEAAEAGEFQVFAVGDVDQAIELLTGLPAGMPDEQGVVPEGSINHRVATRLVEMSFARQEYGAVGKRRKAEKRD